MRQTDKANGRRATGARPTKRQQLPSYKGTSILALCLLLAVCFCACAELASEIPEGKLLWQDKINDSLEVGVYGPATAVVGEPALLTVMIFGNEATRISSGMVLLAAPRGSIQFRQIPPASVQYVPCRQWSADTASEWKQLLAIGPEIRWAYNILPLAHIGFQAGPGELLDSILSVPERPSPPADSPFRKRREYDQTGVAFITDESVTDATVMAPTISAGEQCQGAHGVRAQFPGVINDPSSTLHGWILLNANGQYIHQAISLNVSSRPQETVDYSEVTGPPELSSPGIDQEVSGVVDVMGQTKSGLLVSAWVEIYDPLDPELRTKLPPARHIADDFGYFKIPVNLPFADAGPDAELVYELHVRTEAPAYRSEATIRKLNIVAEEE